MSYTRVYHEVVHGSKTVFYGPSKNGGSTTVSIDIPVTVHIHVDTVPFDSSVRSAERNIDLLTGAVVATETAAITAKRKNAHKVADTIVNGFFSYVKSEISQQISEITQQTEALLMHIRGLSDSCLAKKDQMTSDYNRITSRYMKLFTDLNKELSSRIHQLDQRAFLFKELTNELQMRTQDSGAVSTIMVFSGEHTDVQVKMSSALAKRHAANAMQKIATFLSLQNKADAAIRHCMLNGNEENEVYLPLCMTQTTASSAVTEHLVFIPVAVPGEQQTAIKNRLAEYAAALNERWVPIHGENLQQTRIYFNKELNERLPSGDIQTDRLRKMIQQLAKIENIQAIN
ncbi:MAG: hypothetical protein V4577_24165 [Bacteroidota bacterium]